jgi:anti-sigma B factor antagonist
MSRDLGVRVEDLGYGFRLLCSGEIDISNAEELRNAIDLCLGYRPLFLEIDFSSVTFVAWAGVEVLVYAKGRCLDLGVRWSLPESRHVRRLLHAVGCSSIDQLKFGSDGVAPEAPRRRVV